MQTAIGSFFKRVASAHSDGGDLVDVSSSDDDAPLVSRGHVDAPILQRSARALDPAPRNQRIPVKVGHSAHRSPHAVKAVRGSAYLHGRRSQPAAQPVFEAAHVTARDGAAIIVTPTSRKRQLHRYEEEAEECSDIDDDDEDGSDDSFVVSDHASGSSCASCNDLPAMDEWNALCASMRNRRQFVQCPQCLRLIRAIADFMSAINNAARSLHDA